TTAREVADSGAAIAAFVPTTERPKAAATATTPRTALRTFNISLLLTFGFDSASIGPAQPRLSESVSRRQNARYSLARNPQVSRGINHNFTVSGHAQFTSGITSGGEHCRPCGCGCRDRECEQVDRHEKLD